MDFSTSTDLPPQISLEIQQTTRHTLYWKGSEGVKKSFEILWVLISHPHSKTIPKTPSQSRSWPSTPTKSDVSWTLGPQNLLRFLCMAGGVGTLSLRSPETQRCPVCLRLPVHLQWIRTPRPSWGRLVSWGFDFLSLFFVLFPPTGDIYTVINVGKHVWRKVITN